MEGPLLQQQCVRELRWGEYERGTCNRNIKCDLLCIQEDGLVVAQGCLFGTLWLQLAGSVSTQWRAQEW